MNVTGFEEDHLIHTYEVARRQRFEYEDVFENDWDGQRGYLLREAKAAHDLIVFLTRGGVE